MYFKDSLRYRQVWLGFALIWIIMFHWPLNLPPLPFLRRYGYGGVDICIFASGIGCFYSLCSESNILAFLKRRLKRLIPTYLIFIIAWLIYQILADNFSFQMALGNILAVQNFTGLDSDFNWYISAILLFYILAPYFKAIVDQASPAQKALFLLFLLVFSIPFWRAHTYIITVTRLPLFFIGMLFADLCKKDVRISNKHIAGMIVAFIFGAISLVTVHSLAPQYLWSHGLYWYPFILITPPLCIAISRIAMVLEKAKVTKPLISFLSLCGNYSFELYLVHILLTLCISAFIRLFKLSHISNVIWGAGTVLIVVGCFMLRRFTVLVTNLFNAYRSKNR